MEDEQSFILRIADCRIELIVKGFGFLGRPICVLGGRAVLPNIGTTRVRILLTFALTS